MPKPLGQEIKRDVPAGTRNSYVVKSPYLKETLLLNTFDEACIKRKRLLEYHFEDQRVASQLNPLGGFEQGDIQISKCETSSIGHCNKNGDPKKVYRCVCEKVLDQDFEKEQFEK
jgi:hypothetical protein